MGSTTQWRCANSLSRRANRLRAGGVENRRDFQAVVGRRGLRVERPGVLRPDLRRDARVRSHDRQGIRADSGPPVARLRDGDRLLPGRVQLRLSGRHIEAHGRVAGYRRSDLSHSLRTWESAHAFLRWRGPNETGARAYLDPVRAGGPHVEGDGPLRGGPVHWPGRDGRGLRGVRSPATARRGAEDAAALRRERALPVQARVSRPRRRAPHQPRAPARAGGVRDRRRLLHDGARARSGFWPVRPGSSLAQDLEAATDARDPGRDVAGSSARAPREGCAEQREGRPDDVAGERRTAPRGAPAARRRRACDPLGGEASPRPEAVQCPRNPGRPAGHPRLRSRGGSIAGRAGVSARQRGDGGHGELHGAGASHRRGAAGPRVRLVQRRRDALRGARGAAAVRRFGDRCPGAQGGDGSPRAFGVRERRPRRSRCAVHGPPATRTIAAPDRRGAPAATRRLP